jgi:hypothetical protein
MMSNLGVGDNVEIFVGMDWRLRKPLFI